MMFKGWFTEVQLALITVYVIVMVDVFGLTLIFPVIVTYAKFLGASAASIGYLYAVYSAMALLCSFFIGKLSDRYGRRAVFLYCCVGVLASFIGSAFSTTFIQFAACRAISGLFTGTTGNAYAYIDDIVPEADKAKYMSYITATMSICFVVGPIIGGGFAAIDIRAPFVAAAVMALLELVLIYFFVHDPAKVHKAITESEIAEQALSPSVYNPLVTDEECGPALTSTITNTNIASTAQMGLEIVEVNKLDAMESGHAEIPLYQELDTSDTCMNPIISSSQRNTSATSTTSTNTNTNTSIASEDTSTTATDVDATAKPTTQPASISPWLDFPAVLIGGIGNFLNTTTYCGMATIVPLMLMDPSFGVIRDDSSTDDGISTRDSSRISVRISYLLTVLGIVQVMGMVLAFPRVSKRIGLLYTGSVGAIIYGVTFCMLVFVHHMSGLYPVIVELAVGFSLCKPVYPAYLSNIAHKDRRADYQAMSMCFNQGAWIFSIVLTQFWSYSQTGAILYCGGASILNAVMMVAYELYTRRTALV